MEFPTTLTLEGAISMTIYYLYIKTHKNTGLKYLGQTSKNPYKYIGSGTDWKNHLKIHGHQHITEILLETSNKEERNWWGRYYSKLYNIVNAQDDFGNKIWANRIPETGGGGFNSGTKRPDHSINMSGSSNPMYGTNRRGILNPFFGKTHTDEYILKSKQKIPHNIGKTNIEMYGHERAAQIAKKCRDSQRNKKRGNWFNNGITSVISHICPDGFIRGRLKK